MVCLLELRGARSLSLSLTLFLLLLAGCEVEGQYHVYLPRCLVEFKECTLQFFGGMIWHCECKNGGWQRSSWSIWYVVGVPQQRPWPGL